MRVYVFVAIMMLLTIVTIGEQIHANRPLTHSFAISDFQISESDRLRLIEANHLPKDATWDEISKAEGEKINREREEFFSSLCRKNAGPVV